MVLGNNYYYITIETLLHLSLTLLIIAFSYIICTSSSLKCYNFVPFSQKLSLFSASERTIIDYFIDVASKNHELGCTTLFFIHSPESLHKQLYYIEVLM